MIDWLPYDELSHTLGLKSCSDNYTCSPQVEYFRLAGASLSRGTTNVLQTCLSKFLDNHKIGIMREIPTTATYGVCRETPSARPEPLDSHGQSTADFIKEPPGLSRSESSSPSQESSTSTASNSMSTADTEVNLPEFQVMPKDSDYTIALKEKGDKESIIPVYEAYPVFGEISMWRMTVTYGTIVAEAQAHSKRAAKHLASREIWFKIERGIVDMN